MPEAVGSGVMRSGHSFSRNFQIALSAHRTLVISGAAKPSLPLLGPVPFLTVACCVAVRGSSAEHHILHVREMKEATRMA